MNAKNVIMEALGEASALFMSQPIKGTEIVMPNTELTKIADKADARISAIKSVSADYLGRELRDITESNETIKSAASMVGFNVEAETELVLASLDQRVRVNLHQRSRIATLKSLIEEAK